MTFLEFALAQAAAATPTSSGLGVQYYHLRWVGIAFTLLLVAFILINIARAGSNRNLYIRRIAGLNAIDEAIGRATEMGRPVLMVPGLGDLNAISVQALNIFAYVTRTAARFANPIRLCTANAAVYTVAQEVIRDVYQSEGAIERFDTDSVRFLSDRQFAFAASVSGIILREQVAAAFFLGEFFAESLIFAETANSVGAIQVAGSTENTQTPFFIAACDYVLIGEEFYAASAYLTRQPVLVGSLVGQDWCKLAIMAFILAGVGLNSMQRNQITSTTLGEYGVREPLPAGEAPRKMKSSETLMGQIFSPPDPAPMAEPRPQQPGTETPAEGGGAGGGG